MTESYKHKIDFILVLWVFFLTMRLLLSGSVDLIHYLALHNTVDLRLPRIFFQPETILTIKYFGLTAATLTIFNIRRNIFYPIFLISVFYFCLIIYKMIGSYGIWGFYFLPCLIMFIGMFSHRKKDLFNLIVLSYSLFYFFAGVSKIYPFWKIVDWLNGYTIENLLASRMHESILYVQLGINILELPRWIIKFGIIATVLLELSALLIVFKYKYNHTIVPLILGFHLFLFLTGTPGIVEYTFAAAIFVPLSITDRLNSIKISVNSWFKKQIGFGFN